MMQGAPTPPGGAALVFHARRYAADDPAFDGRDLTPGGPLEINDSDKDGLTDPEETGTYGTDPFSPDTDGDGCLDGAEVYNPVASGGGRNPASFWDFFDVPTPPLNARDKIVSIADLGVVVARFGAMRPGGPPPDEATAKAEALSPLLAPPDYHAALDRTVAGALTGPPDGAITVVDINRAVAQFGHSCLAPP
jgi:hypothetical protein